MAKLVFTTKQNDLNTPLTVRLRYGDGSIPNIAGIASTKFKFILRDTNGVVTTYTNATVDDVPDARIIWPLDAMLAGVVMKYGAEVEVEFTGPATDTFPVCDTLEWHVLAEIG